MSIYESIFSREDTGAFFDVAYTRMHQQDVLRVMSDEATWYFTREEMKELSRRLRDALKDTGYEGD
jgi:hypothetical protein